jgi:hypothetical protein
MSIFGGIWGGVTQTSWNIGQTITVGKSGANYTSIKEAMDSITDASIAKPYTVKVFPGVYLENNPIVCQSYVTLQGEGIVIIDAQNSSSIVLDLESSSFVNDITIQNATNAIAINKTSATNSSLTGITIIDCQTGINVNNSAAQLFVVGLTLLGIGAFQIVDGVKVEAGNVTLTNVTLGSTTNCTRLIQATGTTSIMTLSNILSFSPNLDTGLRYGDGSQVAGGSVNFVGCNDGIVIDGNNTEVRLNIVNIFNATNDGFRIDNVGTGIQLALFATTITGASNYNYNILNPNSTTIGNGFTETENSNIVDGAQFYTYLLDTLEGDEALKIFGELHVGTSLRPAESVLGAGDSHTFEYVYTFDGTATYTDRTAEAKSATSSSFQFDGVTANNAIYIGNRFPITFEGIKILIDTVATIGAGEIALEYWNGAWTEFNGCTVLSSPGFLKYAKNYFDQAGSYHIKFNPYIADDWAVNDPPSLGENLYWVRFRIVTAITTSPVIQQIKVHTNRTEINTDGTIEKHMDARVYKKLVVDAIRPIEGSMQNASIYVDENVGVGLENNRYTTVGDLLGVSFELPEDCDTSAPIIFVWKGKFASTGNVDFTVRRKIVKPGDAYTNTEPGASGEVLTVTTGTVAIAASDTREDFRVDVDISDAIPSRASGFGDEIWITLQYPTRGAGNFDYTKLSANYLSDFDGRHVRQ